MRADSGRWTEVSASRYPHEREGLDHVRDQLPDVSPYRAWSNFEFVALDGSPYEVDLLVLGPAGFHLVELKAWSGRITGDERDWLEHQPGRGRPLARRSPLGLTRLKAQSFRSWLEHHVRRQRLAVDVPFVHESLLLHGHEVECRLPEHVKKRVFGRDDVTGNGLRRVVLDRLAMAPERGRAVSQSQERALVGLLEAAGLRRPVHEVRAGSWVLDPDPLESGWGWHDNLARHERFTDDVVRVRRWFVPAGASASDEQAVRRAAEREYRLLRGLDHPGLVLPSEYHEVEDAVAALVYAHQPGALRLDEWVRSGTDRLTLDQRLDVVRGLAEVVRYAHAHGLVHRGLAPSAVLVAEDGTVRVRDWQTAGSVDAGSSSETHHARDLLVHAEDAEALVYTAPEVLHGVVADRRAADVFSLGALAHLVLSGEPPADDPTALRGRLAREGGLDLGAVVDGAPEAMVDLVREATAPVVSDRFASAEDVLAQLDLVLEQLTTPDDARQVVDPLESEPGAALEHGLTVLRSLGDGATSRALLVRRDDGSEAVLKAARDATRSSTLAAEARALAAVPESSLVAKLLDGPLEVGGRTCLLVELAGDRTLAAHLSRGRLTLDQLRRWGRDLLEMLALLEREALVHRDVKPPNLAVRTRRSDGQPHLVLFDFSLAGVAATNLDAGTAAYRDPFLGGPGRTTYDLAAEAWSVSVTLHEMATGALPRWGDGRTDPALLGSEVSLQQGAFDESVAEGMVRFFATALARDAARRFDNPQEAARAWEAVFDEAARQEAARSPEEEAARATTATPLAQSGLSAKALSALEQHEVGTVGDLLALPPLELSRTPGASQSTKDEIVRLAKQWRRSLAGSTRPQASGLDALVTDLLPAGPREPDRAVHLLLGQVDPQTGAGPLAWPTTSQIANELDVPLKDVSDAWRTFLMEVGDEPSVTELRDQVLELLEGLGGTAAATELAARLLDRRGSHADEARRHAQALALVRLSVETLTSVTSRVRRVGSTMLVTAGDGLDGSAADENLDVARRLGEVAEEAARADTVAAPATVLARLRETASGSLLADLPDLRLRDLAAAAGSVAVSARGELYPRAMAPARALRLAAGSLVAGPDGLPEHTVRSRVRARFPEAQPLPGRPGLDRLLRDADIDLVWGGEGYRSETQRATYRSLSDTGHGDTSTTGSDVDARLRRSLAERGFLALAVAHKHAAAARARLLAEHDVVEVDVSAWALANLRRLADSTGADWSFVLRADALPEAHPDRAQLDAIVRSVLVELPPHVQQQPRAVLLTGAGVLVRHRCTDLLADLTAVTSTHPHATWLLAPQPRSTPSASLDGAAVPTASPQQWLRLPTIWALAPSAAQPA